MQIDLDEAYAALADAARAVVERWESPSWKDFKALRQALAGVEAASVTMQGHARQQEDTRLLPAFKAVREALQFANDSPAGGINDTIWMMHTPETLFDYMDEAIVAAQLSQDAKSEAHCTWSLPTLPDALAGIWHSSCGATWSFVDGGPEQNGVRYCQGRGKPVDVQPVRGEQEAKNGD